MTEQEYFDYKGREVKSEVVDGVTRHSIVKPVDETYMASGRLMTDADLRACQKDPRYATDANYRDAVIEHARKSFNAGTQFTVGGSPEFGVLERAMDGNSGAIEESIAMQREAITTYFSDPRYKTSPLFRAEVKELLRQSDPRHMTDLGGVYRYDAPTKISGQFAPEPGGADRTSKEEAKK